MTLSLASSVPDRYLPEGRELMCQKFLVSNINWLKLTKLPKINDGFGREKRNISVKLWNYSCIIQYSPVLIFRFSYFGWYRFLDRNVICKYSYHLCSWLLMFWCDFILWQLKIYSSRYFPDFAREHKMYVWTMAYMAQCYWVYQHYWRRGRNRGILEQGMGRMWKEWWGRMGWKQQQWYTTWAVQVRATMDMTDVSRWHHRSSSRSWSGHQRSRI